MMNPDVDIGMDRNVDSRSGEAWIRRGREET